MVASGLVTLIVGAILYWLQQGNARRRSYREIREDVELLNLLEPIRPKHAERLGRRLTERLNRYLPAESKFLAPDGSPLPSTSEGLYMPSLARLGNRTPRLVLGVVASYGVAVVAANFALVHGYLWWVIAAMALVPGALMQWRIMDMWQLRGVGFVKKAIQR